MTNPLTLTGQADLRSSLFALLMNRIGTMGAQETRSAVWGAIRVKSVINNFCHEPGTDFLQFSLEIGATVFRYSMAVRWGEVRIGVVVPENIRGVRGRPERLREVLNLLRPYPEEGGDFPWRVVRPLINVGVLIDFIFVSRFKELTYPFFESRPLNSCIPHLTWTDVLADALFQEFCHIQHGLLQALTEMNYLITPQGIIDVEDQDVIVCRANLTTLKLAERLGVDASRIHDKGDGSFFVVVPREGGDRDALIALIKDQPDWEMQE